MTNFILGITGGIGCGKTAATDRFAQHGIVIIDADIIAQQVVTPPSAALNEITDHFGKEILLDDSSLNRKKLRKIIFESAAEKNWLEQLLHPIIREEILRELQSADSPYVILSAPLLLENNLDKLCQRILVIDCDENLQIQRTLIRDNSNEKIIRNIISQQIDRKNRLKRADDIIINNSTLDVLHQQIDNYHHNLLHQLNNE